MVCKTAVKNYVYIFEIKEVVYGSLKGHSRMFEATKDSI